MMLRRVAAAGVAAIGASNARTREAEPAQDQQHSSGLLASSIEGVDVSLDHSLESSLESVGPPARVAEPVRRPGDYDDDDGFVDVGAAPVGEVAGASPRPAPPAHVYAALEDLSAGRITREDVARAVEVWSSGAGEDALSPAVGALPEQLVDSIRHVDQRMLGIGVAMAQRNPGMVSQFAEEMLSALRPSGGDESPGGVSSPSRSDDGRDGAAAADGAGADPGQHSAWINVGRCLLSADEEAEAQWASLRERFRCSICQDVLAAPCLVECGHSFCGGCIKQHTSHFERDDDTVEVLPQCPECKQGYDRAVFQRAFDDAIATEVAGVAHGHDREAWARRREDYLRRNTRRAERRRRREHGAGERDGHTPWVFSMMGVMALIVLCLAYGMRR